MRLQAMFYLFAAVVSGGALGSYQAEIESKFMSMSPMIKLMVDVYRYAFVCSLVFFAVHILQWIAAARVAMAKAGRKLD
jgi:hypothetical protein